MNYFAHGFRYIDRPHFLAGTAVPDWLRAAHPKTRLREAQVTPFLNHSDTAVSGLARGIIQHFADDEWFHASPTFQEVTSEVTEKLRDELAPSERQRTTFLAHVITEMVLDTALIRDEPDLLDEYYDALERFDVKRVQSIVDQMTTRPVDRLGWFIHLFRQERFLADYLDPRRLLFRLNQVLSRVRLQPLPSELASFIESVEQLVAGRVDDLLPPP